MHLGRLSTVFYYVVLILLAGILAGCGGDQSGGGSQQQEGGGGSQNGGGAQKEKKARETKIMLGTVRAVDPDVERFTLRPSVEAQGKGSVPFRLTPKASITMDGKTVELADMQMNQQAQVEYIVRKDRNRAMSVTLFSAGGDSGDGG